MGHYYHLIFCSKMSTLKAIIPIWQYSYDLYNTSIVHTWSFHMKFLKHAKVFLDKCIKLLLMCFVYSVELPLHSRSNGHPHYMVYGEMRKIIKTLSLNGHVTVLLAVTAIISVAKYIYIDLLNYYYTETNSVGLIFHKKFILFRCFC